MKGKVCAKCGEWKTLEEYHKNKKTKDGRGTYCKECQKKYQKQWREKNPKYHNSEQQRQYRENNKERIKEYHKQYRKDNTEYFKQYREDNKERTKEYSKQYYKDNVGHIKERDKQRFEKDKENYIILTTAHISFDEFPSEEYTLFEVPGSENKKPIPIMAVLNRDSIMLESIGFVNCSDFITNYDKYGLSRTFIYPNKLANEMLKNIAIRKINNLRSVLYKNNTGLLFIDGKSNMRMNCRIC